MSTTLLIDVGNSRLKWALCHGDSQALQQSTDWQATDISTLLGTHWQTLPALDDVWICNVAGPVVAEAISNWCQQNQVKSVHFVHSSSQAYGVINGYKHPEQLGTDRWVAMIGAYHLFDGDLCIVDCGTAVTLDVLNAAGQHQGGLIMPGLMAMRSALFSQTHALKQMAYCGDLPLQPPLLAVDTQSAITQGILYSVVGMIHETCRHYAPATLKLIITGGGGASLLPLLNKPFGYVPDLVLQGLYMMRQQNNPKHIQS